jgi:hypothetical protein
VAEVMVLPAGIGDRSNLIAARAIRQQLGQ